MPNTQKTVFDFSFINNIGAHLTGACSKNSQPTEKQQKQNKQTANF